MDSKLATRTEILADNSMSVVFERNRLKDMGLNYESHEATIQKNMTKIKENVHTLESQLNRVEQTGASNVKDDENKLIELQIKVDKLEALLADKGDEDARQVLLGNVSRANSSKIVRFSDDTEVNPRELENGQILQLQSRMMDDQDRNLDMLSEAVGRQRELGLLIGDELESHVQLIEETDEMVDRTDTRLRNAQKRLNYVGRRVKDNKSICIVIALIIILFSLIAIFR
ncbi:hypothetical protein K450DRAFT_252471 [Umbelopsis ramanniana AG]|uniref:t-SNARE coiled-coil homology domain-containing protein n=1 Tax=Umbelopsis ramanniana AG TaxID=1314678 RepID=A0AAD5E4A2_UMBRA|nr:uncharacterized protein K450DRAFT_252471 [Umbelopsis ramanniana AG]KAI8577288.1 hypothetical protein K450DRAFT_252471 [Umbelopsis ramanniana AG]